MSTLAELDAPRLCHLAQTRGYHAALAMLYEALRTTEPHADFIRQIDAAGAEPLPAALHDFTIAIVPGALYKQYPGTGGDGRRFTAILRTLGLSSHIIPIKSLGTLNENAAIITAWLAARPGEKILLVSFSKGSADIKTALQNSANLPAFHNVATWFSVGGILNGTPLITWLRRRRLRYFLIRLLLRFRHHVDPRILEEFDHGPAFRLARPLTLPPRLQLIHLVALPTATDLSSPLARRAFHRLLPWGLNDAGGLLLSDLFTFPGLIYPLLNADHYFRDVPGIEQIIAGMLAFAVHKQPDPRSRTGPADLLAISDCTP